MPPYLPVQAVNRSQAVRIGTGATAQELHPSVTTYVDLANGVVKRDLQRHSAVGAYIIVGALTNSNLDEVVTTGATATVTGSTLVVTVAAGELKKRSTGVFITVAGGTATLAAADASLDRTDLVWLNAATGAVGWSKGILAAAATSVAPTAGIGTTTSVSGTTVSSSNIVTVASTTGIAVGQAITGTGVPANNWVTAVTSATTFTTAYNETSSATNTLTLINTVADCTSLIAATVTAAATPVDVRPRP